MYQSVKIKDCTRELVGFRQPMSDCYGNFDNTLNNSESGMYFEDFHDINRTENLRMISPDFNVVQDSWLPVNLPPVWDGLTTYNENDIVTTDGTVTYISLQDSNTGNTPDVLTEAWRVYEYKPTFENWLLTKRDAAVASAINSVFLAKRLDKYTKSLFKDSYVFQGIGSPRHTETKSSRFVGWRVMLSGYENLRLHLHKLGLQFSLPQTSLTVFIYHPSVAEPVFQQTFTTTSPQVFEWKKLTDWLMFYANDNYDTGLPFYIGYYEDDVVGEAINKREMNPGYCPLTNPCGSCNSRNRNLYDIRQKWFSLQPFYVDNADLDAGRNIFDIGDNESTLHLTTNKTYGLNFLLSVQCDLSDFLCRHTDLMTRAIGMQFTCDMLKTANASLRTNQGSTKFIDLVMSEYERKKEELPNAFDDLEKEIEALDFDLSEISPPCMPCKQKGYKLRAF